jgi:hypothetical protein
VLMRGQKRGHHPMSPYRSGDELRGKVGDGVSQAADFISAASSIPSLNFTPSMTFGNWF